MNDCPADLPTYSESSKTVPAMGLLLAIIAAAAGTVSPNGMREASGSCQLTGASGIIDVLPRPYSQIASGVLPRPGQRELPRRRRRKNNMKS